MSGDDLEKDVKEVKNRLNELKIREALLRNEAEAIKQRAAEAAKLRTSRAGPQSKEEQEEEAKAWEELYQQGDQMVKTALRGYDTFLASMTEVLRISQLLGEAIAKSKMANQLFAGIYNKISEKWADRQSKKLIEALEDLKAKAPDMYKEKFQSQIDSLKAKDTKFRSELNETIDAINKLSGKHGMHDLEKLDDDLDASSSLPRPTPYGSSSTG